MHESQQGRFTFVNYLFFLSFVIHSGGDALLGLRDFMRAVCCNETAIKVRRKASDMEYYSLACALATQ